VRFCVGENFRNGSGAAMHWSAHGNRPCSPNVGMNDGGYSILKVALIDGYCRATVRSLSLRTCVLNGGFRARSRHDDDDYNQIRSLSQGMSSISIASDHSMDDLP
jgi:hypothetical protein